MCFCALMIIDVTFAITIPLSPTYSRSPCDRETVHSISASASGCDPNFNLPTFVTWVSHGADRRTTLWQTYNFFSRSTITSHYSALHDLGVIHNDVDPKHWLLKDNFTRDSIRIIDFEASILRDIDVVSHMSIGQDEIPSRSILAEDWEELSRQEMLRVEEVLDAIMQ